MELLIEGVSKKYSSNFWGVKDFSLKLNSGVLGLLGPNGAGKSTLMRMVATITRPSEGRILWNGHDSSKNPDIIRKDLGYLPQDFGVYPHLNAVEFLKYIASIKGIHGREAKRRIDELLILVNLTEACKRPIGGYSGGMRQRVGIAQALLNDPKLLIVDEPTVGLDPEERVRFRNLLSDLSGNRIVIFSTHIVPDVEATATRIAIISHGKLLTHALPEKLLKEMEGKVWGGTIASDELENMRNKYIISGIIRRSDGIYIRIVTDTMPELKCETVSPSLEDAYLYYLAYQERRLPNEAAV